jgi:hypothetical protein
MAGKYCCMNEASETNKNSTSFPNLLIVPQYSASIFYYPDHVERETLHV